MYFPRTHLLLTAAVSALLASTAHSQGEADQRNTTTADTTLEEVLIIGVR